MASAGSPNTNNAPPTVGSPGTPTDTGGTVPNINPTGSAGNPIDPTLGSGSFPWLQRWTGPFSTPMNGTQNSAISGMQNFMSGGYGGGGGGGAAPGNFALSPFKYDPTNFTNMQSSLETLQGLQDSRALQQLQSSAAAGGNALSGGLMQQEGDYLRGSNAATQQLMEQARMGDVQSQRALWNALNQSKLGATASEYGSSQSAGASRYGSSLQNQLGNRGLNEQALNDLFRMGTLQQNSSNQELSGQYNDWLRQLGGLQQAYQYPDQLAGGVLGRGYPQTYQPTYGQSGAGGIADILTMLSGGGGSGVDWNSIINSLGGGGTTSQDAHEVHYDGATPNHVPMSYQDQGAYNDLLTAEQSAHTKSLSNTQPNAGLNAGLGTAGLLLMLLKALGGGGKSGGSKAGGGQGSGASSGGNLSNLFDSIFGGSPNYINNTPNEPGTSYGNPIGPTQNPDPTGFQGLSNNSYNNPIGPSQYPDPSGFFGQGDNAYQSPIGPTQPGQNTDPNFIGPPDPNNFNGLDGGGGGGGGVGF